jgi:large conductance mechanosensitive channel
MVREYREFILQGGMGARIVIGFILGSSITKFVNSLVDDVIMAPVGLLVSKKGFENMFYDLSGHGYDSYSAAKSAGVATLNYGTFLSAMLHVAVVIFIAFPLIFYVNKVRRPVLEAPAPQAPPPPRKREKQALPKGDDQT